VVDINVYIRVVDFGTVTESKGGYLMVMMMGMGMGMVLLDVGGELI
jgi:hypothetical protein